MLINRVIHNLQEGEKGFTLVELLIVMVISLIMLAGMVGLLSMGFQSFTNGRDLQSVTDASRRVLPAMDRQIKSLLHINDTDCLAYLENPTANPPDGIWNGMSFYSNVVNNALGATANSYTNAEKVEYYLDTTNHNLMQRTTTPGTPPVVGTPTTLCSYVESFRVFYFPSRVAPDNGALPDNCYKGTSLNSGVGSVKIVIKIKKGTITRTFEQTSFLRVLLRS